MTILEEISQYAKARVNESERTRSFSSVLNEAESLPKGDHPFLNAIEKDGLSIIAEIKKASPSKGIISKDFDYKQIAIQYQEGGANAISCLTEPKWFLGSNQIFAEVRKMTSLPMLRKDFTISEYQIAEAKLLGADAVLLIAAILSEPELREYLDLADSLGLDAVIETHNAEELEMALRTEGRIIGVNNRALADFTVDLKNAESLSASIPDDRLFIAESGISDIDGIKRMKTAGADGVLVGEFLMRSSDPASLLREIRAVS